MQVMSNYQIFIALLSVTVKTNMILLLKQFSELKEQSFDISKSNFTYSISLIFNTNLCILQIKN